MPPRHALAGDEKSRCYGSIGVNRQRVNVTTADLPGPEFPLYFAGVRLLEVFPLLPLIGRVSLGVGAMSYAGQFNITAVADQDAYPDLDVFANGARDELGALAMTAGTSSRRLLTPEPQPSSRSAVPSHST